MNGDLHTCLLYKKLNAGTWSCNGTRIIQTGKRNLFIQQAEADQVKP